MRLEVVVCLLAYPCLAAETGFMEQAFAERSINCYHCLGKQIGTRRLEGGEVRGEGEGERALDKLERGNECGNWRGIRAGDNEAIKERTSGTQVLLPWASSPAAAAAHSVLHKYSLNREREGR